jgi:eukaryotic-like serine/threonine-protein kinase
MTDPPFAKGSRPRRAHTTSTPLDQALGRSLVRQTASSTVLESGGTSRSAIPRLRNLAGLLAMMTLMFAIGVVLLRAGVVASPWPAPSASIYISLGLGFFGSLVMVGITRLRSWAPEHIVDAGALFQVFGAFVMSLGEQQLLQSSSSIPMVCIWILSFTLVPASPARSVLAAYAAAATGPLALALHIGFGDRTWPPPTFELVRFLPAFFSAAIAIYINRVIHGLGRQVADAKSLGAYHLVEMLGRGGMGEVWRAEHQSLIRPAAVKILRREVTSLMGRDELDQMNLRFQREVQATALLTSPHTVAVYDFGQTSDGTLYYVMEMLNGLDAETMVRRYGPQPAERVIYLLRQACESLAEAHHRDLIHRDVKPANVYLCAVGMKVDFVKILDFGLVRDLNSNLNLTNEGAVSGTPAYLAPESAAKNKFDARSDIYALGCVAYWMLTGTLVFDGATAAAVMAAHIRDTPDAPSSRTELPIPAELETLVLECLAKDPNKRPQTAEKLRRRLDAIELATPWQQQRAAAWWGTHQPDLLGRARTTCAEGIPAAGPAHKPRHRPAPVLRETAILPERARAAKPGDEARRE